MNSIALRLCLGVLPLCFCAPMNAQLPSIHQLFPEGSAALSAGEKDNGVDFHLDGTLSMRGFARAAGGQFPQLLQDLDLAFSGAWKPDNIHYSRFGGSVIDPITQRPFYAVAANESFFKGTKEYQKTQIENVFRRTVPGQLNIVMTDLFEQDLDISAIQQSLDAASFPAKSSLAVWQWQMPFDGTIYDYDFRNSEGRAYKGERYLYMLALGSRESIEELNKAITRTVTIKGWKYLLLSKQLAADSSNWLHVTRTNNAALKTHNDSLPVYRISRGCDAAELTSAIQLAPEVDAPVEFSFPGAYQVSLFALIKGKESWQTHELTGPEARAVKDPSGHPGLQVKISCSAVSSAGQTVLRIRRVGTDDDVKLPPWVDQSSATNAEFDSPENLKSAKWGEKTLNLKPFLRELATKAVAGTTIATAYVYVVSD